MPTTYALARLTLAFIWLYHGLVPKLLVMHPDELLPLTNGGVPRDLAVAGVYAVGAVEIAIGLAHLVFWRRRWLLLVNLIAMPAALVGVALTASGLLTAAFNPVTLNLSVVALSLIAYRAGEAGAANVASP